MAKRVDCWEVDGHRNCIGCQCKACDKCNYNNICIQSLMTKAEAKERFLKTGHDSNDWGVRDVRY